MGYTSFKGFQLKTSTYYNTDWNSRYGWKVIKFNYGDDIRSMLQPGDIVVRVPVSNGTASNGHMNIFAAKDGDKYIAYDCGASSFVAHGAHPNGINSTSFYSSKNGYGSTNKAGVIIRAY